MRAQNDALVRTYTANRTHRYRNRKKNLRVSSARRFDRPRVRGGGWSHACCIVGHRAQLLPEEGLAGKSFYCEAAAAFAFFFLPPGADFSVFTAAEDFSASSRASRSAARASVRLAAQ